MIDAQKTEMAAKALDALLAMLFTDKRNERIAKAIQALGEELHEIGGITAMHDAMMDVGDRSPDQEIWRDGALNVLWDGIGTWLA